MGDSKVCAECKNELALDNFYRDKSRPGGFARICKDCDKAASRKRYYANHEESKAKARQWGANNKERRSVMDKAKYAANRERMRAQADAWKIANPERVAQFKKNWQARHQDRYLSQKRANEAKRRARKASSSVFEFTLEQLEARLAYYGYRCWICKTGRYEELDHVKPLSKGGAHMLCNLRPACKPCNRSKWANWPLRQVA